MDKNALTNAGYMPTSDRRMIRSPKNPLDKCTIVSIYPKDIEEIKPTIFPGRFKIPSGSYINPSLLIVESSAWYRDYDADQEILEITNSSIQVAEDVVRGYCNALPDAIPGEAIPGLFFILGEKTLKEINKDHRTELEAAKIKQDNYWKNCVKNADSDWARTNNNPLAISDEARLAARELSLSKPWMMDFTSTVMKNCPACGFLINSNYPVCSNCKTVIDKEKATSLGLITV